MYPESHISLGENNTSALPKKKFGNIDLGYKRVDKHTPFCLQGKNKKQRYDR